ncbi:hypothetical protein TWF788_002743 [Orbilia oligospora]|uniref:Uncharacterized protein n=1 Tax=Orbilia oligospora TaxID=2813651 RepID=A0A7C8K1D0_ORBOL|nr:hypothetical protein TWF788_002743 [Orbilia oligospora]
MAGKNKTEATQVRAEYLGLRPAIGSRDNLAKDPYFQPVQVESSKVPARAPDGWLATVGKTRPFRKPCDNSGNKVCHRVYGGDANNVSGSPCGGVAAQLDNGRATRQSAHSPILPEPPGEDGLPACRQTQAEWPGTTYRIGAPQPLHSQGISSEAFEEVFGDV